MAALECQVNNVISQVGTIETNFDELSQNQNKQTEQVDRALADIAKQNSEVNKKLKAAEQQNIENIGKVGNDVNNSSEQIKALTEKDKNIETLVKEIVNNHIEKNQEVIIVSEKTGLGTPTVIPMQPQNVSTLSDSPSLRENCTPTKQHSSPGS